MFQCRITTGQPDRKGVWEALPAKGYLSNTCKGSSVRSGILDPFHPRRDERIPTWALESFDFSFQPLFDRNRVMALARLEFFDRAEVLHIPGPQGVGKSRFAGALAVTAAKAGKSAHGQARPN